MRLPDADLIPLKVVLYGTGGLFPDIRYRDVPAKIGRIYRRKSRYSRLTHEYVRVADYQRARTLNSLLANATD